VHRRHELLREERAHRLPDEVRRRDSRDPEPVRDLGGERRLAGPGGAADEQHDRQIQVLERLHAAQTANRPARVRLAEDLDGELGEAVEVEAVGVSLLEIGVGPARELVRARQRQAGGCERPRHQPLRERRPLVATQRQRRQVPPLAHAPASAASRRSSASRSGSPGTGTTSFAASTTSAPRARASSATTSTAAALSSTR
jgi:hypothetical protein